MYASVLLPHGVRATPFEVPWALSPVALPPSTVSWKLVRADTLLGVLLCPSEPRDCTGSCRMTDLSVLRCSQVSDLMKMLGTKTWALRFHLLAEV